MLTATKAFDHFKLRWLETVKADVSKIIEGISCYIWYVLFEIYFIKHDISLRIFMAIIKITEILKILKTGREPSINSVGQSVCMDM